MNKSDDPLKLVPLAIPAGWTMEQNHFYQTTFEEANGGYPFYEDILQMNNKDWCLTIDLGWYPEGDPNGTYRLYKLGWEKPSDAYQKVKKTLKRKFQDENFVYEIKEKQKPIWSNPISVYEAKTWQEIALKIEEMLNVG